MVGVGQFGKLTAFMTEGFGEGEWEKAEKMAEK